MLRVEVDGAAYGLTPFGGLITYWDEMLPRLADVTDLRISLPARIRARPPLDRSPEEGWTPALRVPTYYGAAEPTSPSVLVVHDLIYEDGFADPVESGDFATVEIKRRCIQAASRIVVPSKATLQRLAVHYPGAVERTRVVHHGVDECFRSIPDPQANERAAALLANLPCDAEYVLHVGGTAGYKDFSTLVKAVGRLQRDRPCIRLISVGDHLADNKQALADDRSQPIMLGYVERPVLAALYRNAAVVASASLAEGFGLPVAEAMAAGCPLACSDSAVHREVAGASANYFTAADVDGAARAIATAIDSPRPPSAWSRSWDDTAAEFVSVMHAVVHLACTAPEHPHARDDAARHDRSSTR